MKEIIDGILGLIGVFVIGAATIKGGHYALEYFDKEVRRATIEALKRPSPRLERFTQKLTGHR